MLLQESPEAVLGFSVFETVDEQGETIQAYPSALELPSPDRVARLCNFLLQEEQRGKANLIYGLMRRRAIQAAGGFRIWGAGSWGADMLVVFRLLGFGDLVLANDVLFHKRLPRIPAKAVGKLGGYTVERHVKGIRGWHALFTGYAHIIASDEQLPWQGKTRLCAALLNRVARVGASELGRHLRPSGHR